MGVSAHGPGLGRPPHAVSTRTAAVRADRVRTTRRTSTSPWKVGPTVTTVCHLTAADSRQPKSSRPRPATAYESGDEPYQRGVTASNTVALIRTADGSVRGGLAVLLWLDVFRPAGLAAAACPLPAVLSGVPALLAYGVGVAGVQVRSRPVGLAAQEPCFEAGEGQESVDPEQDYRCDDDVLPPHCESPLAGDVPAVLPEAVVTMRAWAG